jgi:hypothetical protein
MTRSVSLFPPVFGRAVESALGAAYSSAGGFVRWSVEQVLVDGGQATARRNAWIAMGREARLARDRREADEAMALAVLRAAAMAAHPAGGSATPGSARVVPNL